MLGSGSLVTPLEAATSLDSELDEELGSLEGLGELDGLGGLGLGCLDAAAGAVTAAAVQLQAHQPQQAGTVSYGARRYVLIVSVRRRVKDLCTRLPCCKRSTM